MQSDSKSSSVVSGDPDEELGASAQRVTLDRDTALAAAAALGVVAASVRLRPEAARGWALSAGQVSFVCRELRRALAEPTAEEATAALARVIQRRAYGLGDLLVELFAGSRR